MALQTDIYLYKPTKAPTPKEAKYYYKVTCKGQFRQGWGRAPEGTTGNQAVLMAAMAAFTHLVRPAVVTVHTDCSYVATYHKYAQRWQQNGWLKADGKPAKNADLWEALLKKEAMHAVSYRYHRVMPREEEI